MSTLGAEPRRSDVDFLGRPQYPISKGCDLWRRVPEQQMAGAILILRWWKCPLF